MIEALKVPKQFGTYTDSCLLLGLAQLASTTQRQIYGVKEIQLTDLGTSYRIQFKTEIDPEEVANNLKYEDFLKPVKGDKTEAISGLDWSDIDYFDTKQNSEKRNRWREYQRQRQREKLNLAEDDTPSEPDARTQNGTILTSMRHDRNHNALYKGQWEIQDDFGALVAAIFKAFADSGNFTEGNPVSQVAKYFQDYTGKSLPSPASAVKIFLPTCVQGVNRPKADNNKADSSQKEDWVLLWLIATGLFEFGVAERIKVAEGTYDWRMVALEPKAINLFQYRKVLDELRKFNPPSGAYGIARFDAEMVLGFSQKLLQYHPAAEIDRPVSRRTRSPSIKEFVSGFSGTHFGSKGQVYGVKEVFSLGIPDWIRPDNAKEVKSYQELLTEHLAVVKSLSADEGNGELLTAYRDFITGSDRNLNQFFRFNVSYADYIVRQLADPQAKFAPKQFSQAGLNIMTQSFDKPDQNWSVTEITQNQGFQRIARAINSATVYAGKIKTKQGVIELDWQRTYGLAQRLGNHAGSKKDFIAELTAFLTNYENENLRISEQLQKEGKSLMRVWTTKEDLEQFLGLLDDKRFSYSLVANLLLAYGYSKWKKPLKEEAKNTPIVEDDNVEDNN
jgi:hypothetical protein